MSSALRRKRSTPDDVPDDDAPPSVPSLSYKGKSSDHHEAKRYKSSSAAASSASSTTGGKSSAPIPSAASSSASHSHASSSGHKKPPTNNSSASSDAQSIKESDRAIKDFWETVHAFFIPLNDSTLRVLTSSISSTSSSGALSAGTSSTVASTASSGNAASGSASSVDPEMDAAIPPKGRFFFDRWKREDEAYEQEVRTKFGTDLPASSSSSTLLSQSQSADAASSSTALPNGSTSPPSWNVRQAILDETGNRARRVIAAGAESLDLMISAPSVDADIAEKSYGLPSLPQRLLMALLPLPPTPLPSTTASTAPAATSTTSVVTPTASTVVPSKTKQQLSQLKTLYDVADAMPVPMLRTIDFLPSVVSDVDKALLTWFQECAILREDDALDPLERDDDELCREIRSKQRELRELQNLNRDRAMRILALAKTQCEADAAAKMERQRLEKMERVYKQRYLDKKEGRDRDKDRDKEGKGKKKREAGKGDKVLTNPDAILKRYEVLLERNRTPEIEEEGAGEEGGNEGVRELLEFLTTNRGLKIGPRHHVRWRRLLSTIRLVLLPFSDKSLSRVKSEYDTFGLNGNDEGADSILGGGDAADAATAVAPSGISVKESEETWKLIIDKMAEVWSVMESPRAWEQMQHALVECRRAFERLHSEWDVPDAKLAPLVAFNSGGKSKGKSKGQWSGSGLNTSTSMASMDPFDEEDVDMEDA
jgi:hypothetical protein